MTARQAAISEIATHRVAKTQDYLKDAGADIYGDYVFNEAAQSQYLAKPIFRKLRRTMVDLNPIEAMETLQTACKKFKTNDEFLAKMEKGS